MFTISFLIYPSLAYTATDKLIFLNCAEITLTSTFSSLFLAISTCACATAADDGEFSPLLTYTSTVVLPILLGYIVWLLKQQKKDKDANSKGTMLLLRVQLIEYHDKYMKLGEIPSYAYDNFVEMYNAYHALGGNGMVTKMYDEIQEIHLKNGGKD